MIALHFFLRVIRYQNIGNSLRKIKRFEEAIQMYDKAIQLNPQNSQAHNNKG